MAAKKAAAVQVESQNLPFVIGSAFNIQPYLETESTAAIQAALQAIPYGGTLMLGPGTYRVSNLTLPPGVSLVGAGPFATVLLGRNTGETIVTLSDASSLRNLKVDGGDTRSAGFSVVVAGNGVVIDSCTFYHYYIAITAGALSGPTGPQFVINPQVRDCNFAFPQVYSGGGAAQFLHFSNAQVTGCVVAGPEAGAQPDFGLRFQNGDTAFVSNNNITVHGQALLIDTPPGFNIYSFVSSSNCYDSSGPTASVSAPSSAAIIAGGGVYNTQFSNDWFGLSRQGSGCLVTTYGTGLVDGVAFTGCQFPGNKQNGLTMSGSQVLNWQVTGGHSEGNASGIAAQAGTSRFTITGHRAGNAAGRGPNNIGINVLGGSPSNHYVITGNNTYGNTSVGIYDGGTGTHKVVANNL
ncbi:MAG: hypothetical protein IPG50_12370 [Myxococcales bacterium]|nr:hypothetical protein [Myxococcales bacterium]